MLGPGPSLYLSGYGGLLGGVGCHPILGGCWWGMFRVVVLEVRGECFQCGLSRGVGGHTMCPVCAV